MGFWPLFSTALLEVGQFLLGFLAGALKLTWFVLVPSQLGMMIIVGIAIIVALGEIESRWGCVLRILGLTGGSGLFFVYVAAYHATQVYFDYPFGIVPGGDLTSWGATLATLIVFAFVGAFVDIFIAFVLGDIYH